MYDVQEGDIFHIWKNLFRWQGPLTQLYNSLVINITFHTASTITIDHQSGINNCGLVAWAWCWLPAHRRSLFLIWWCWFHHNCSPFVFTRTIRTRNQEPCWLVSLFLSWQAAPPVCFRKTAEDPQEFFPEALKCKINNDYSKTSLAAPGATRSLTASLHQLQCDQGGK